jgi:hypothetical protein
VIHTAGVVSLNAPKKLAYLQVIEPTLRGIEHLLSAVNKAESVEKGKQGGGEAGHPRMPIRKCPHHPGTGSKTVTAAAPSLKPGKRLLVSSSPLLVQSS